MTPQERIEYARETDSEVVKYYYEFNLHGHLFYYNGRVGGASSFKDATLFDTRYEASLQQTTLEHAGFELKSANRKEIFKKRLKG